MYFGLFQRLEIIGRQSHTLYLTDEVLNSAGSHTIKTLPHFKSTGKYDKIIHLILSFSPRLGSFIILHVIKVNSNSVFRVTQE